MPATSRRHRMLARWRTEGTARRRNCMISRVTRVVLVTALVGTTVVAIAQATSGPPPPPKAVGGGTITQVASGLKTPTSFAFGDGQIFEGDGGNSSGKAPPNGGVFV